MKKHKTKSSLAIALLGTVLSMCSAAVHASPYSITELSLGGSYSYAYGINDKGEVVGSSGTLDGAVHAFLYSGSTVTDIGTLMDGSESIALDINNNGQVVAWSHNGQYSPTHGYIYQDGSVTNINMIGTAINDAGQVVGGNLLYSNGTYTDLGNFQATDINNSGLISGYVLPEQSAVYDNGTIKAFRGSRAEAINDNGIMVGYGDTPYLSHALLYSNGNETDLGTLDGYISTAYGINNLDQIVGSTSVYTYTSGTIYHGFIYRDGTMIDLNDLIDANSGWTITTAYDINNSGQIVGNGLNSSGQRRAFLMTLTTPVPEPETYALMLTGIGLMGFMTRRRKLSA